MAFTAIAGLAAAGTAAYGAYSADKANKANFRAQQNERARQLRMSAEQEEMARQGSIDARGNRTRYVEGVGWVEEATPLTRALMARSDAEELARLTQDAPRNRMQREALWRQQQQERGVGSALLARMNQGTRSLADTEADAVRLGVAEAVSGPQQLQRDAVITALRQGTGAENVLAGASRAASNNTRIALERARSGAPTEFANRDSARMNDSLNRYGQLMSRALASDNAPFVPTTAGDALMAARTRQQAQQGLNMEYAAGPIGVPTYRDDTAAYAKSAIEGISGGIDSVRRYMDRPRTSGGANAYALTRPEAGFTGTYGQERTARTGRGGIGSM